MDSGTRFELCKEVTSEGFCQVEGQRRTHAPAGCWAPFEFVQVEGLRCRDSLMQAWGNDVHGGSGDGDGDGGDRYGGDGDGDDGDGDGGDDGGGGGDGDGDGGDANGGGVHYLIRWPNPTHAHPRPDHQKDKIKP